jgi:MFS transporter, FHS family, glucose/mannose:H+ symporter
VDVSPSSTLIPASDEPASRAGGGKALAGFLLSGFLMALLGAILPVWGYYRDPPAFVTVGNYFLSLAGGMVISPVLARRLMASRGLRFLLVFACCLSCGALAYLALVSPLAGAWWRASGLLVLGLGAGLLNLGLFCGISTGYSNEAAGMVNRGGIWYGLGCLIATLLAAATFSAYAAPRIVLMMALVPGIFAAVYWRSAIAEPRGLGVHAALRQALSDFRSLGAVLFVLLLFFQFANEWSIAGWLPLFLIRRVGLSPGAALRTLALYWMFLLLGRLVAVATLPRVHHGLLLGASVVAALFGCVLLFLTNNAFGATSGVLLVGGGYSSIYPLVAEAIGHRFSYYHPGFFNGIFSLATMGGLLAPATLGYAASSFGVGVVVGIPLVGTCLVLLLVVSIWVESRFAV